MVFTDSIVAKGYLTITLYDKNGKIKDERHVKNTLTQIGRYAMASLICGDGVFSAPCLMSIGQGGLSGSGFDATQDSDENLRTPFSGVYSDNGVEGVFRTLVKNSNNGYGERSANTVVFSATFEPECGTGAITEAGLFVTQTFDDDSKKEKMFNRSTFAVVSKEEGDTLTIEWAVEVVKFDDSSTS